MNDKPNDNRKPSIYYIGDGTFSTTLMRVALRYPYMFKGRHFDLIVHRKWISAFEQTCMDIDKMLGQDKCGFHWTELTSQDGHPCWYWELADAYNLSVVLKHVGNKTTFSLVDSPLDPGRFRRDTIHCIVDWGVCVLTAARTMTPKGKK